MTPKTNFKDKGQFCKKIIKFALKLSLKFIRELFGEQGLKFRYILLIYKYLRV